MREFKRNWKRYFRNIELLEIIIRNSYTITRNKIATKQYASTIIVENKMKCLILVFLEKSEKKKNPPTAT